MMNQRRIRPTWNQDRSILFVCDEYQEIISVAKSALSDLSFWDKSRSAKCVGVISAQGVESFRAAIGDQSLTDALLQNFRQIICFRTEDRSTIERMTYLLGKIERETESKSRSRSSTSRTYGTNTNKQLQATIDPQLFRQLRAGEAIAILSINNESYDDIIVTSPIIPEKRTLPVAQHAR
jgi:type IV secretory pathway TraG/TraD family ATPase VirD4